MTQTSPQAGCLSRTLGISASLATGVRAIVGVVALASLLELQRIETREAGNAVPNPRTMTEAHRTPALTWDPRLLDQPATEGTGMECHRWYPTVTPLADGRSLIGGGGLKSQR